MKSSLNHRLFLLFYLLIIVFPVTTVEKITFAGNLEEDNFVEILDIDIRENRDLDYSLRSESGESIYRSGIESFVVDKNERVYLSNFAVGKIKIYNKNLSEGEIDITTFSQPRDIEITANTLYIFEDLGKVTEVYLNKDKEREIVYEQDKKHSIIHKNEYQISMLTEEDRDEEIIKAMPVRFVRNYQDNQILIQYENHSLYCFRDNELKEFNLNKYKLNNSNSLIFGGKVYKQIIGIDENGYIYLSGIEVNDLNDQIDIREYIYKFNKAGDLLAVAETINEKNEIVPFKYIDLNSSGDVFQLLVLKDRVKVYKLRFREVNEIDLQEGEDSKTVSISPRLESESKEKRKLLYDRALELLNYKWIYKPELHGAYLKNQFIPYYLREEKRPEELTGIPYTWGGFDSLNTRSLNQEWSNFTDALNKGAAVGNLGLTANYLPGTAGLDCSGFISAVLGLETRKPSWYFYYNNNIVGKKSYDQLEFMDILVKNGHMFFYLTDTDYGIRSIESNTLGSEWKVKYYIWSWRALRDMGYSARGYLNYVL